MTNTNTGLGGLLERMGPGILAIPAVTVLGRTPVVVHIQPQMHFHAHRLVVEPECAPFFEILDIQIANVSFLLGRHMPLPSWGTDRIPATLFPPLPFHLSEKERLVYERLQCLNMHTCSPAQSIQLTIALRPGCVKHEDCLLYPALGRVCGSGNDCDALPAGAIFRAAFIGICHPIRLR